MSWTFECETPLGSALRIRRHRLHNGLCLVSVVDDSAPIVAYQSWFSVGSRNEEPGRTGMCHLFEHLMFNEMRSLPMGEFDRRIEAVGGDTNAATWVDWTYYRASIPKTALELITSLEAMRMTDLVLSPSVVEAEREVVINERLQCIHDDVDGFAGQELFRHAFEKHGYRWPTIGWMEDIESLSIADMEEFYRNIYAPNNLTLVVVGDIAEDELLASIEAHYGALESSNTSPRESAPEPPQLGERRHRYEMPTKTARLLYGYKAPPQGHPDWPLISFTCQLVAGSASSPMHNELVIRQELASSVSCEVMPFRDASLIELSATATPHHTLEEVEACIARVLGALASSPPPLSSVEKVANQVETEFWGGLTTVDGKAELLGHYQCVHGDYRALFEMASSLAKVTAADVQRIVKEYFVEQTRTVILIESEKS